MIAVPKLLKLFLQAFSLSLQIFLDREFRWRGYNGGITVIESKGKSGEKNRSTMNESQIRERKDRCESHDTKRWYLSKAVLTP